MKKEFIPKAFESCPEEFRKIRLIAERLLKWELLEVEYFGTEECSARQSEIEKEFPGFLDDAHAGQTYWVNPYHKLIRHVDKFNPFISLDDAFLILTKMGDFGEWILTYPEDDDRFSAAFSLAPHIRNLGYKWPSSLTFRCRSLQYAITNIVFQWAQNQDAVPEW